MAVLRDDRSLFDPELEAAEDWEHRADAWVRAAVAFGAAHAPEIATRLARAGVEPDRIRGSGDLAPAGGRRGERPGASALRAARP